MHHDFAPSSRLVDLFTAYGTESVYVYNIYRGVQLMALFGCKREALWPKIRFSSVALIARFIYDYSSVTTVL